MPKKIRKAHLIREIIKQSTGVPYFPQDKNIGERLNRLNTGALREVLAIITGSRPHSGLSEEELERKIRESSQDEKSYVLEAITRRGLTGLINSIKIYSPPDQTKLQI